MGAFSGGKLYKKNTFSFLKAPRQIFLTIFNENIFLKAWGTRLGGDGRTKKRPGKGFDLHISHEEWIETMTEYLNFR